MLTKHKASKNDIRKAALAKRDVTDAEWREEASRGLTGLADQIETGPDDIVSGFWPIRSEIDVRALMKAFAARGVSLALPVVLDRETIVFRHYAPDAPLVDTGFGTSGPGEDAPVVDPTIMLVPLAAFDDHGNRIGYGAGHYDRAIAKLIDQGKRPRLIGVAFDCQRVDDVPAEPHDVPLDAMLTESGLRFFTSRR